MSDMNQLKIININMPEYDMLRKAGQRYDVKVNYVIRDGKTVELHMRGMEFYSYESAAAFLRRVLEKELMPVTQIQLEVLR